MLVSKLRAHIPTAARWLAPSAVAAAAGAIAAGAVEARGMSTGFAAVAAAGFLAIAAVPLLVAASVIVRGLWAAWQPRQLGLVEPDGGAPRLAAWIGVIVLGAAALAWAMFQGTWLLSTWTAFKATSLAFAEPVLAISATLVLVIVSRPLARAITAVLRWVDARWRRRGRRSLLTPARIAIFTSIKLAAIGGVLWWLVIRPWLGVFDISVFYPPVIGVAVAAGVHAAWSHVGRARRIAGPVLGVVAAALIGCALYAWRTAPSLTLAIWGERPLAGFTIDRLFDLDSIRASMSLVEFRPAERAGARHPDIVLITIDTVRADHTPPYGGKAAMPVLTELAARGTVFEWAFSPSNVTRRSIPSMIIGLGPDRVRGRVVGWALRVDPRHVLVAERLKAGGYETAGFMCCGGFWGGDLHTGLDRGLEHLEVEPNGLALARRARAWLDQREQHPTNKPLFLWMHILEPHNWATTYGEPRNEDERRRNYDRALAASDVMLTQLLGAFSQRSPDRAPIVIVSADHGEGLGDHNQPFHSTDLYDSQTHVPLVIAGPGIRPGRIPETVSLTDLTPTLLDLAGFEPPHGAAIDGHSFADLATGRRAADPEGGAAFAAMILDRSNTRALSEIIKGRWKLIIGDKPNGEAGSTLELYDTRADPDEHANMITSRSAIYEELKQALADHRELARRSPFE